MSTFSQILPMANIDPPQGEQSAAGFSDKPKDLAGAFEKMMTHVLSPPSSKGTAPNEQSQSSQKPAQPAEVPANISNKMPEYIGSQLYAARVLAVQGNPSIPTKTAGVSTTDSKATTQASGASNKDKKSQASAEAASGPSTLETFLNQIFAVPVLAVDPIGKSSGEKSPEGSTMPSQAGTPELSALSPAPTRTNPASAGTTKVPVPGLSASQMAPMIETGTAQQTNSSAAKETASAAKNAEPTLPQTNLTTAIALKPLSPELPGNPTAAGSASGTTPDAENTTATLLDSSTSAAAQPPPVSNGTSIAKQDIAMKQAEKTNKIAGQTEKVLPGNVVYASRGNLSSGTSLNTDSIATTVTATAGSSASDNVNALASPPSDSVAVAVATNDRANALGRTQELVTVSAARLSDSGNNSMQVVIKPDAGTQLSLELRQQGGNVEVQAVLQQGDFNHLNQQWPELQQRLEERGIRLAPLTDDGASGNSNSGSETSQNNQSQANEVVPGTNTDGRSGGNVRIGTGTNIGPSGLGNLGVINELNYMPAASSVDTNYNNIVNSTQSQDSVSGPQQTLTQNNFLQLLVAQMENQDPLQPQSDTEMASQMAQFTSLSQTSAMSSSLSMMQANSLIGSTVTVQIPDSQSTASGVVQNVLLGAESSDGTPQIVINGTAYDLSSVLSVDADNNNQQPNPHNGQLNP